MEEDIKKIEEFINDIEECGLNDCGKNYFNFNLLRNLLTRYKECEESLLIVRDNYIPKSKIKEKIKELNKQIEEFKANLVTAKEEIEQAYWKSEMSKAIAKRSVLQELLEEE